MALPKVEHKNGRNEIIDYTKIVITIANLKNHHRNNPPPLIWLSENWHKADTNQINSDKKDVKKWIKGDLDCDLISDYFLVQGFEHSTVISISPNAKKGDTDCLSIL